MGYIRLDEQPGEVYHYTHRKNLDSILRDGRIRRMGDRECWFCASLEDTLTLMRATVMMEGKPYSGSAEMVISGVLISKRLLSIRFAGFRTTPEPNCSPQFSWNAATCSSAIPQL